MGSSYSETTTAETKYLLVPLALSSFRYLHIRDNYNVRRVSECIIELPTLFNGEAKQA